MRKAIFAFFCAALSVAVISCGEKENQPAGEDPGSVDIEVVSLVLDRENISLYVSESISLQAGILPENATDKTVFWASSNTAVADVDKGVVTAYREGTAIITAKAGKIVSSCMVVVLKPLIHVESISLNKLQTTIEQGDSETLIATVNPLDTDFPQVSWSSSDETVAVVTDGVVTAIAEGVAVITATADGKSCSCTVTVPHIPVPVSGITLDKTEIILKQGDSETLVATVAPANAEYDSVVWSSSDSSVATVGNGVVSAIGVGEAVITVEAGGKTASCVVKVREKLSVVGGDIEDLGEIQPVIDNTITLK